MHALYPVIFSALLCGMARGQLLAKPIAPVQSFFDSWNQKPDPARSSSEAAPLESAVDTSAFQEALGRKEIIEDIHFPKLRGKELASLYRACTGRRVIATQAADTAEFFMEHEASLQHPVTYAQAAELIRKSAFLEGFVFVEHVNDPNLDILTDTSVSRTICDGFKIFHEETPLPEGDEVITYVMTFSYLEPEEAVAIFTRTIGKSDPFSSIVMVPKAPAIVVTQRTSIIRKLVALKIEMDKP